MGGSCICACLGGTANTTGFVSVLVSSAVSLHPPAVFAGQGLNTHSTQSFRKHLWSPWSEPVTVPAAEEVVNEIKFRWGKTEDEQFLKTLIHHRRTQGRGLRDLRFVFSFTFLLLFFK